MTAPTRLALAAVLLVPLAASADDWPQWLGPNRDSVWRETGILEKFPEGGPKVLWRVPAAWGYAGPAVAGGKVYLFDYVTDADILKLNNPQNRPPVKGTERLRCLDAKTGNEVWKYESPVEYKIAYPGGPRCTPTIADGKVYTLGAEGNLTCLDAASGKLSWSKDFKKDYQAKIPIWGVAGHPLVDGNRLICIVGGSDATVVAFDKDTGAELWKALNAREPGYSSPAIIEAGGARQLLVWDSDNVNSLDPATGKVYWSVGLAPAFAMSIMTPHKDGDLLYVGGIGGKGVALKLAKDKPAAEEAWRGDTKTGLYPVNMTPFVENGTLYGVDQGGDLMAVELATGKRLWATFEPVTGKKKLQSSTAFLVKNGDRFFLFTETGDLVIAKLTPAKYEEVSRAKVVEPTNNAFGRSVVWSHPAFAEKCAFVRNDKELVCVSLAEFR